MQRNVIFEIYGDKDDLVQLIGNITDECVTQIKYVDNRLEIQLTEIEDFEIRILIKLVTELGYNYNYFEERVYSKAEINKAEYYGLYIYYPWQDEWKYAKDYGTTYNENGEQTSDLIVNMKKIKKNNICTILPEDNPKIKRKSHRYLRNGKCPANQKER